MNYGLVFVMLITVVFMLTSLVISYTTFKAKSDFIKECKSIGGLPNITAYKVQWDCFKGHESIIYRDPPFTIDYGFNND